MFFILTTFHFLFLIAVLVNSYFWSRIHSGFNWWLTLVLLIDLLLSLRKDVVPVVLTGDGVAQGAYVVVVCNLVSNVGIQLFLEALWLPFWFNLTFCFEVNALMLNKLDLRNLNLIKLWSSQHKAQSHESSWNALAHDKVNILFEQLSDNYFIFQRRIQWRINFLQLLTVC